MKDMLWWKHLTVYLVAKSMPCILTWSSYISISTCTFKRESKTKSKWDKSSSQLPAICLFESSWWSTLYAHSLHLLMSDQRAVVVANDCLFRRFGFLTQRCIPSRLLSLRQQDGCGSKMAAVWPFKLLECSFGFHRMINDEGYAILLEANLVSV